MLARVKGIVGEGELASSAAGLLTTTLGSATQSLPHRETANTKIQNIQKYKSTQCELAPSAVGFLKY